MRQTKLILFNIFFISLISFAIFYVLLRNRSFEFDEKSNPHFSLFIEPDQYNAELNSPALLFINPASNEEELEPPAVFSRNPELVETGWNPPPSTFFIELDQYSAELNSPVLLFINPASNEEKLEPPAVFSRNPEPVETGWNPPPPTFFIEPIVINPPSAPPTPETRHRSSYFDKVEGISFWGSLIYWRPRQSFMDIALKTEHCCEFECPTDVGGASWKHAERIEIHPEYKPGFKIGFELARRNWGIFADYTYFDFDSSRSVSVSKNGFLFGRWIQPGVVIDNSSTHLKAKWELRMNVLNFEAGRKCYFGRRLMLKPHFGLAGAEIDQELKARFLLVSPVNKLKMLHKSDSWGVGPRVGVNMDWRLFRGFGIVGTVAADLLYTHYDLHLRARSPTDPTVFAGISSHLDTLRGELEFYLGLNSHFRVSRRTFLNLEVGYDSQIWWNQNMMRWNNDAGWTASPEGNLYLEGLRLTLKLDF